MLADAESFGVSDWSRHDGGVARSDMGLLVGRHRFFGRIGTGNDRHGSFRSGCPYAFARHPAGSVPLTLRLIALMRLRFPEALIPATTALATLDAHGREAGILAGANVVMPNLSPLAVRGQYSIYDHKASGGSEAAEGLHRLEQDLKKIGYHISYGRGDSPGHGGGK